MATQTADGMWSVEAIRPAWTFPIKGSSSGTVRSERRLRLATWAKAAIQPPNRLRQSGSSGPWAKAMIARFRHWLTIPPHNFLASHHRS